MSGEPTSRDTSGSRRRHIMARVLAVLVLLAIVLTTIGLAQGRFGSNWLKVAAVVGIVVGLGGILRTVLGKETRGEILNLVALALALVPLIVGPTQGGTTPDRPAAEPTLSPVDGLLPYRVTGTGELGLLVRTCPAENCGCSGDDCDLLGTAGENSPVWVECSLDSGFAPSGEPNSIWHKIHWPNSSGNTRQFFESKPGSQYSGWVFSRYAIAASGNDNPPSC